ncbi:MAG: hypothetical protein WKF80_08565 [Thermomicrobiales bacterium]
MMGTGRGWWGRVLVGLALLVVATGGVMVGSPPRVIAPTVAVPAERADPLDDLLGWLPVTDETRAAFAVWDPRLDEPGPAGGTGNGRDTGGSPTGAATPGDSSDATLAATPGDSPGSVSDATPGSASGATPDDAAVGAAGDGMAPPELETPADVAATVERDPADLGIEPRPRTLGLTAGWRAGHGWDVADVSAWATGGAAPGETVVLAGTFDAGEIRAALLGGGYRETAHRGVPVFTLADQPVAGLTAGGDAATAANAVALLGDRLVTAMDPALVLATIDAATGAAPSLADLPAVVGLRRTLGPVTGFAATDAATLARRCLGLPGSPDPPSERLVAVAHGRTGPGEERRTLVAVTFADEAAAADAAASFAAGWPDATLALGQVTAPIDAYADPGPVARSGTTVVAELPRGRVRGWAPLVVRLASPVCDAVRDAHVPDRPAASPVPVAADRLRAALAALPDLGPEGRIAFADLAAIAGTAGVAAPAGLAPDEGATRAWLAALGPLPDLAALPPAESLVLWPATFGVGLDRIDLVAVASTGTPEETVAVIAARFDPASTARALDDAGYDRTIRDGVAQWALPEAVAVGDEGPARLAGGELWDNVAVFSGLLVLSPSTATLRDALAGTRPYALGSDLVPAGIGRALVAVPGVTAGVVSGAGFARAACAGSGAGIIPETWDALATLRTGAPAAPTVVLALPGPGRSAAEVARAIQRGVESTGSVAPHGASPVAGGGGAPGGPPPPPPRGGGGGGGGGGGAPPPPAGPGRPA